MTNILVTAETVELNAYSPLRHFVGSLLLRHNPVSTWVSIGMAIQLTAYLDDSGHPDDQDAVVVAGWVATLDQWLLLEDGWKQVLTEFGIASGVFHRTDFQAGYGEYRGMSCSDKCRLIYKLINHITTRTRYSFCSIVPMFDYKDVNEHYYLEEGLGKPYALGGATVAVRIQNWKQQYAPNDPIVVILEEGSKHKGDLEDMFIQNGFDRPGFRLKKNVVALQAADLLAWECFHAFKVDKMTRSFSKLLTIPFDHGVFSAPDLVEGCESGNIPKRIPGQNLQVYFRRLPKKLRTRRIVGSPDDWRVRGSDRIFDRTQSPFLVFPDDFCGTPLIGPPRIKEFNPTAL